jgi:lipid-binding SYLF domain-containing protein
MKRHKWISMILSVFMLLGISQAATDRSNEIKRIESAATVMDEIMAAPDKGIPEDVLSSAKCVAVVPSMIKGGFIVGADYGKGVATCRTESGWSAPAPFVVGGGSFGLQVGGEAVDLVMLVMNEKGMRQLLSSKFKLGADASVAAGPVGRRAEGNTDWKMRSEVLTYSRARGIFAGISLNGAVIRQDNDDTRALYGKPTSFSAILKGQIAAPVGSEPFLTAVTKYAAQARKEAASESKAGGDPQTADNSATNQPRMLTASEAKGQIEEKLRTEPGLDSKQVRVSLTDKTVELSGSVATSNDRQKAIRIAQSFAGDRQVEDHLTIQSQ